MADHGVPISTLWQRKCKAAERENDPRKLTQLLKEAEFAIFIRLQKLAGKKTPEHEAIANAIKGLRQLQVTKLNFPKWERASTRRQR